jgi:hypothetical protein
VHLHSEQQQEWHHDEPYCRRRVRDQERRNSDPTEHQEGCQQHPASEAMIIIVSMLMILAIVIIRVVSITRLSYGHGRIPSSNTWVDGIESGVSCSTGRAARAFGGPCRTSS